MGGKEGTGTYYERLARWFGGVEHGERRARPSQAHLRTWNESSSRAREQDPLVNPPLRDAAGVGGRRRSRVREARRWDEQTLGLSALARSGGTLGRLVCDALRAVASGRGGVGGGSLFA